MITVNIKRMARIAILKKMATEETARTSAGLDIVATIIRGVIELGGGVVSRRRSFRVIRGEVVGDTPSSVIVNASLSVTIVSPVEMRELSLRMIVETGFPSNDAVVVV
jgi:hypothetical protein